MRELRTPQLLVEVARRHPRTCRRLMKARPLLAHAASGDMDQVEAGLFIEEKAEREKDRRYWLPLRKELEDLRRARLRQRQA